MDNSSGPTLTPNALNATNFHSHDASHPTKGALSLIVVFGSSLSLVGLVFAFITYRWGLG